MLSRAAGADALNSLHVLLIPETNIEFETQERPTEQRVDKHALRNPYKCCDAFIIAAAQLEGSSNLDTAANHF